IEYITVGRIAPEQTGASERSEKQHPVIERIRQCNHRRWRAHIANKSKNLIFFVELLRCDGGSRGLIAVVRCDKSKLAAVYSAICVGRVECRFDTELHILAELLSGAG